MARNKEVGGDKRPADKGYRLDEIIKKLRRGELFGDTGGYRIIGIDSSPDLEGDFVFGPGGYPEIGFGQKFENGFTGWERGERVRSRYKVVKMKSSDGERIYGLQVAESVVGDIRHADTFLLDNLFNQDMETLGGVGMAEVEAVVEVIEKVNTERQISNMQEYSARIDRLVSIQKPWNGKIEELKDGQSVLLEGEVISYKQNREYPYDGAKIVIKIGNGLSVPVKLWNGYLDIEAGVIDRFDPKGPEAGDMVQINATYGNPEERYGREEKVCFFAYFCRSTYLLAPNKMRETAYREQRKKVADWLISTDKKGSSDLVRKEISRLINSCLTRDGGLNLTDDEKLSINQLIEGKITREDEKPLELFDDLWGMEDVRRGYGVDVYGMSRKDFYHFCLKVASGEKNMIADGSPDSPWRILRDNLNPKECEEILSLAIDKFSERVIGKRTIMKESILANPDDIADIHDKSYGHRIGNKVVIGKKDYDPKDLADPDKVTWEDQYLLEQTLRYYNDCLTTEAARRYLGLVQKMGEKKMFMRVDDDRFREFCEYEIVDSMINNVTNNIIWKGGEWGTEVVGLRNQEAIRAYLSQMKMLRTVSRLLRTEGWTNDGCRRPEEHVEKLIKVLETLDTYLRESSAHLN